MKYLKRAIPVEAVAVKDVVGAPTDDKGRPAWFLRAEVEGVIQHLTDPETKDCLAIETNQGWTYAKEDDWVLCGPGNDIYPCNGAVFAATYDAIEEEIHEGVCVYAL